MSESGNWPVIFSSAAAKQKKKLPESVAAQLASLAWDLEQRPHPRSLPTLLGFLKTISAKWRTVSVRLVK